jgi:CRP-like cAMP-binding protein
MMLDLSPIAQSEVLRGLTNADLAVLGEIACEQEFHHRDCLFQRGADAKTFYIATRGRFALTVDLRSFDDSIELAVEEKRAPDAFGWSSLVAPRTSIYSAYCTEDGAVVAFPRDELEELLTTHTRLGEIFLHNLNELIGTRVRALQKLWLDEISQSSARVSYWSHSKLTTQWASAMTEPNPRAERGWLRRHTHIGRGN